MPHGNQLELISGGDLTRFFIAVTIEREHKTRTNHNRAIKVLQIRQIPGLVSQLGLQIDRLSVTCNWKGKNIVSNRGGSKRLSLFKLRKS